MPFIRRPIFRIVLAFVLTYNKNETKKARIRTDWNHKIETDYKASGCVERKENETKTNTNEETKNNGCKSSCNWCKPDPYGSAFNRLWCCPGEDNGTYRRVKGANNVRIIILTGELVLSAKRIKCIRMTLQTF